MKCKAIFFALFISNTIIQLQAQTDIPKGFLRGEIVLADGSKLSGYIKENIRSNASLVMIPETAGKKKTYNGNEITGLTIDSTRFLCIKGDFFKVICEGDLYFLQKASDASGKAVYNGTEAVFINGTEGKINDYFFYDNGTQELKLLTKKSMPALITSSFSNCTPAINKAKEAGDDPSQLKLAVNLYNSRSAK